jgi:CheY-like chemotaxis protein
VTETFKSILLIDDDIVDVMAMQRLFQQFSMAGQYHLYVAQDGREALAMLRGDGQSPITPRPRVIFLDLNMPHMDGFAFLHELQADEQLWQTRVIVLTTSSQMEDQLSAYRTNVAGYLIKPITLPQFVKALTTLNRF